MAAILRADETEVCRGHHLLCHDGAFLQDVDSVHPRKGLLARWRRAGGSPAGGEDAHPAPCNMFAKRRISDQKQVVCERTAVKKANSYSTQDVYAADAARVAEKEANAAAKVAAEDANVLSWVKTSGKRKGRKKECGQATSRLCKCRAHRGARGQGVWVCAEFLFAQCASSMLRKRLFRTRLHWCVFVASGLMTWADMRCHRSLLVNSSILWAIARMLRCSAGQDFHTIDGKAFVFGRRKYCCLPNDGQSGQWQDWVWVNCPLVESLFPAE